jgi:ribonucleoside-triphosphate reductase
MLIQKIAHNTKITYFDFAVTFSICENTHTFNGAIYTCPTCGGTTVPFDRIVGYYRPRENSNTGRRAEIEARLPVENISNF